MPTYLTELADSHRRVCARIDQMSDAELRRASLLPGWTRDMVVAHLRFAADAAGRAIDGVKTSRPAVMYPGGDSQREAEIGSGAGRSADELSAALRDACSHLEDAFASLADDAWDQQVQTRRGPVPVRELLLQRWVDVEAHHVDLDVGYTPGDWPRSLVDAYLPLLVSVLPVLRQRPDADRSVTGSWHLHRTDTDGEWTVRAQGTVVTVGTEHEKSDAAIRGTGHQLMALLLGRGDVSALEVFGDQQLASALKRAFPGP